MIRVSKIEPGEGMVDLNRIGKGIGTYWGAQFYFLLGDGILVGFYESGGI